MIDEDGGKKDLEIKQLKKQNEILNKSFNQREIALNETL